MRKSVQILAVVGVVALTASACGSKPAKSTSASGSYKACMVTDTGGIDDRSFNASAWKGMLDAQKGGKVTSSNVQSTSENDYVPNINALINKKCDIIVTVGGLMSDATKSAAQAHTDQKFAIVDAAYDPPLPNVFGMEFNTAQGAFLGGYLAAGMTKTGAVATYGGIKIAPVTIYMDGFWEGVQYYNKQKNTNVKVLGWSEKTQNGTFANSFTDQNKGKQITNNFEQQGADIVFPVAGGTGLGSGAAAQASGGKLNLLWVDFDGCENAPQYCPFFISSVVKNIPAIVTKTVDGAAAGSFSSGAYVGTLQNDGTSLAPFHQWASKVPADLKSELQQIQQGIIGGTITITSPAQPKS
ncbi:MAG TPA: BMP family ABC transporter substrate-binding protein [Mycobacteriales bacterium]|nr:BMP family ABC transporter substrate-binding protein [Mycobacteriales bacterium]